MTTTEKLLTAKRILILGYGVEGQSTERYLQQQYPDKEIVIVDKKIQGDDYLANIPKVDLIFKTPGIPLSEFSVLKQHQPTAYLTSQTQLFLEQLRDRVVGVTGTKGKSTTSSLIYHLLKSTGKKVVLVGNIGTPFLDLLNQDTADTRYVAELSCHQLSDLSVSPHIAVLLNIYKEHLDYYQTFENYCLAKFNITKFQTNTDIFVYNRDQTELLPLLKTSSAVQQSFSLQDSEIDTKTTNKNNVLAAVHVAAQVGLSDQEIAEGVMTFQPLAYRLEEIGTYNGITFIDDDLATIPEATIIALSSFDKPVTTLIAGGYDRGQEYQELAKEIINKKIKILVLFPTTGVRLKEEIKKLNSQYEIRMIEVLSMEEAVGYAYQYTEKGTICLLSPAASSFSGFKNYKDRAEQFRKQVKKIGEAYDSNN